MAAVGVAAARINSLLKLPGTRTRTSGAKQLPDESRAWLRALGAERAAQGLAVADVMMSLQISMQTGWRQMSRTLDSATPSTDINTARAELPVVLEVILRYANYEIPLFKGLCEQIDQLEAVTLSDQTNPMLVSQDDGTVSDWRLTAAQRKQAVELFQADSSMSEIARATQMAFSSVRAVLEAAEVLAADQRLDPWHHMTPDETRKAGRLRDLGWSYRQLGEKFGVSRTTVAKRLKGLGS